MVFEVPKSKRSIKQNRYEFSVEGETFSLPKLEYVPVGAADAFQKGNIIDGFEAASGGDDRLVRAVAGLDADQLQALMKDWEENSDVSVGESPASDS